MLIIGRLDDKETWVGIQVVRDNEAYKATLWESNPRNEVESFVAPSLSFAKYRLNSWYTRIPEVVYENHLHFLTKKEVEEFYNGRSKEVVPDYCICSTTSYYGGGSSECYPPPEEEGCCRRCGLPYKEEVS